MKKFLSAALFLSSCVAVFAAGNLIEDASFSSISGKGAYWIMHGKGAVLPTVENGTLVIKHTQNNDFSLETKPLKLADPSAPLKISVEIEADAKPTTWRYMMVLAGTYTDNKSIDWSGNSIIIPRKNGKFQKFERIFFPAKPIKKVNFKILAEAVGTVKVRNLSVTPATAQDLENLANLLKDPHFSSFGKGGKFFWHVTGKHETPVKIDGGVITLQTQNKESITIYSERVTVRTGTNPMKFVLEVDSQGKPHSWRHAALVDIHYIDGTKEKWGKTMINLPHKTNGFQTLERTFVPAKDVKEIDVKIMVSAPTVVKVRNVRVIPQVVKAK